MTPRSEGSARRYDSKILLVDDVNMFLELQKTFLKLSSVHLFTAQDGVEALQVMRKERPSLVFMDLHMPRMDGAECCARMKADAESKAIPVVMITSEGKGGGPGTLLQGRMRRLSDQAAGPGPVSGNCPKVPSGHRPARLPGRLSGKGQIQGLWRNLVGSSGRFPERVVCGS